MISSLYNGVSALKSITKGIQLLGNNISNVNSVGYKSSRARFTDNFYQYEQRAQTPVGGTLRIKWPNLVREPIFLPLPPISSKELSMSRGLISTWRSMEAIVQMEAGSSWW